MTKLEMFRDACAAAQDAPPETYGDAVKVMHAAYDDLRTEPNIVAKALTLVDDPNPMVRYMVAVIIRPAHRERADAMFKEIAEERSGIASIWAMTA